MKYQSIGNGNFGIIENDKLTNGWRVNLRGNYVTDFSGKLRGQGSPFCFIRSYCNLTNRETINWFKDNFNIKDELKWPKNKGSPKQKKSRMVRSYSRTWLQ